MCIRDSVEGEHLLVVPLDAIPVLSFDAIPTGIPGTVMGGTPLGHSGAEANPWQKIGDRWWRYELQSVTLTGGPLLPADGKTPSTWWTGRPPGTPVPRTALALLNWLPTPFSRAVPYGEELVRSIDQRWGTVCHPAAPAAPVLWTFDGKPPGPNPAGWRLHGIPWPDPPDTVRSEPAQGQLEVTEPWRVAKHPEVDLLQGTDPARVVGDHVPCSKRDLDSPTRSALRRMTTSLAKDLTSGPSAAGSAFGEAAYQQAVVAMTAGVSLSDLAGHHVSTAWSPETTQSQCRGAILRSPVDDLPAPAPRGDQTDQELVKKAWDAAGFTPDKLRDAVRLTPSEPALELSVLMMVPERALERGIILRVETPDGDVITEHPLTGTDRVTTTNPIPSQLTDPNGPWLDPVLRAARIAALISSGGRGYAVVWVPLRKLDKEIGTVVIGWRDDGQGAFGKGLLPFYIVAVSYTHLTLPTSDLV